MLCFASASANRAARNLQLTWLRWCLSDGRVLPDQTAEHVHFERALPEGIEAIRSMALEIVPEIAALPMIDSWAGFRHGRKDGLPVTRSSAEAAGLFLRHRLYRNGILLRRSRQSLADEIIDGIKR